MKVEKRKHARFLPPPNTFAALGKGYARIGKMIDICNGGLSFEYLAEKNKKLHYFEVDIFLVGNVFCLYSLPCKIVYDIQIHEPHVKNEFIKVLTNRKCGVKFKNLTEYNNLQIQFFIDNYTEGYSISKNILTK